MQVWNKKQQIQQKKTLFYESRLNVINTICYSTINLYVTCLSLNEILT
jgi:hypothetical protein